jgi:hypothetical protein
MEAESAARKNLANLLAHAKRVRFDLFGLLAERMAQKEIDLWTME